MEIILLERVDKLGKLGDVVKVKPGYARNYLLPTGKAFAQTKQIWKSLKPNAPIVKAVTQKHAAQQKAP